MTEARFEIVTTSAGAVSIRCVELNEIMHNPVGPWVEANALYIEQSELRARLASTAPDQELVVFDVGLGAAANALATLHAARTVPGARLRLVSFERDLELTHFALDHAAEFAHFAGWTDALSHLLKQKEWSDGQITWELREGDFLAQIETEPRRPHLIFYDPYSQKVNREMWTTDCFRRLRRKCREAVDGGSILFTYSQSTPVRVALLEAGFFVGYGRATGLKEETTQGATVRELLKAPLGLEFLKRWRSSHTKYPFGHRPQDNAELEGLISNHAQFSEG